MSIHEIAQRFVDWLGETLTAIVNYPIDWKEVFQWIFAFVFIWGVICFFIAAERGRKDLHNKRKAISKMTFDPAEMVTFGGNVKMTLRSAVAKVTAMSPSERSFVRIFREGEPSTLDSDQIDAIAALPNFKNSN
jgi:hypothetical protein